jgi:ATP-binding cassette subfamily B protein RaxB
MQTVVDDVVLKNDHNLLFVLALGFAFLLVIEIFTNILREFVTLNMSTRLSIQMSANIFQHLIRLPMDYFLKRHVGDITSRFGSMSTIRELLTNGIVAVAIDGLMAIITLTVMFFYSVKLTFIVIGVVCLYAVFRYAFYKPIRLLSEEAIVASAKESSHFLESIRAVQTIKLLSKETDRQSQWQNKLADSMNKGIRMAKWNIGFSTVNRGLFGIENIVIIYFAANSVMDNVFSVGMLFAFMSYKGRFIGAMDNLISKWIEFRMLDLHFDRLADIVFTETDTLLEHQHPAGMNEQENSALQGKIEARNISFAYSETDSPVFKNLNFTITPGETVAIIGASGCGKSTLLKCLMSFTAVTEGSLLVDDCLIEKIPNYRSQIAGVLQDDQLLSGSISDNIACFDTKIDMEYVIQCAKQACMHDDISAMSMQYNTLVGDMGSNLSGGQKQRVIIARALYRRPKILFMDEATSHLDIQNEVVINQNIKHLDITRIIVAHRPETILSAERILQIHDGQLVDVTIDYRKAMGVQ